MSNDSSGPDPYGQSGDGQQPESPYTPPPAASQPPPSYSAPNDGQAPPAAYPPPPAYGTPQPMPGYAPAPGYGAPGAMATGPDAYAAWPTRAAGYIIDILLGLPGAIIAWIGAGMAATSLEFNQTTGRFESSGGSAIGSLLYFLGLLIVLVIVGWNRWYKGGKTGQSVGRGVMGTKLISEQTGQPIGPLMAFVRDIAHFVDSVICYIGWLFPLWDAKRQTLADKIMTTVVVPAEKVGVEQTFKTWNQ